jgi:hypothetical protein
MHLPSAMKKNQMNLQYHNDGDGITETEGPYLDETM